MVNIRTTPLENTTIKQGGRKRNLNTSKMAKRPQMSTLNATSSTNRSLHRSVKCSTIKRNDSDKRRRSSLLRRLSSKRASADVHQLAPVQPQQPSPLLPPQLIHNSSLPPPPLVHSLSASTAGTASPTGNSHISSSKSFQSFLKASNPPSKVVSDTTKSVPVKVSTPSVTTGVSTHHRLSVVGSTMNQHDSSNSSLESSPTNSVPNSPASIVAAAAASSSRPSSLDGLKLKLKQPFRTPRRKSCGHIPLSPLARATGTGSPVPVHTSSNLASVANSSYLMATGASSSPVASRSPSPLALPNVASTPISAAVGPGILRQHRFSLATTSSGSLLARKTPSSTGSTRPKSFVNLDGQYSSKSCDTECPPSTTTNESRCQNFSLSKSRRECSLPDHDQSPSRSSAVSINVEATSLEKSNILTNLNKLSCTSIEEDLEVSSELGLDVRTPQRLAVDKLFNRVCRSSSDPVSKDRQNSITKSRGVSSERADKNDGDTSS